ncbi:MAG: hypothetical protein ACRD1Y_01450, partial [Terriglobales bacterium]
VNDQWILRARAFYYSSLYADPKNPDLVYAPQIDALWVSRNAGKSWKRLRTPHGDNHIVWINPRHTNILLEGNDGGATVSTDGGLSWSQEHNQPTGQMYHVNLDDEFPFHIYGAQQDEGASEGPSATSSRSIPLAAWKKVAGGESTRVVPVPGQPWISFGSDYFSLFTRGNRHTGEATFVSPQADYRDGQAASEQTYRFGWTHAITFSPVNPDELLLGSQYVLESLDLGQSWKRISPDLTRNDPATEVPAGGPVMLDQTGAETYPGLQTIAVSPLNGEVIWAGSDDGLAHVTRNGGRSWENVTPPTLPKFSWISCIEPSYAAAGTAYLTARRYMQNDDRPYVFKTTDYGRNWTAMVNGIPQDHYVFDLSQDPDAPNLLFLATSTGVEVSLNGGQLWQPLRLNLPTVQVRDVRIDRRQGQLVIATHGRAFWVLDNLSMLEQISRLAGNAIAASPYLFTPQTAWLSPAYGRGRRPAPNAGENPGFGATVFFTLPASYDRTTAVYLTFADARGHIIRGFTLTERRGHGRARRAAAAAAIGPGMNRFQWDLRYPSAENIGGGFMPPEGVGIDYNMAGPVVTPGTYTVTLSYGSEKLQRRFTVALDPRIHAAPGDLEAQLKLELEIHHTLVQLDQQVNRAIHERARLQKDPGGDSQAAASLTRALATLVQLDLRGGETDAVFATRLHLHLAFLAAEVGEGYSKPTPAEYEAFRDLSAKIVAGEQALSTAMQAARTAR